MAYAIYILPCLENFTKDIFIFPINTTERFMSYLSQIRQLETGLQKRFLEKRKEMYRKEFNKLIICADIYIQTVIYRMVATFTMRK
jgi:hypothetical protein